MANGESVADVQVFLRERIETYEEIETLLFLRRQGQAFSAESVSTTLGKTPEDVARALDHLCNMSLLQEEGDENRLFRYSPESPSLDASVAKLAEAWNRDRLEIVKLMTANAIERVRTKASQAFADAFLLWKRKNRDG